LAVDLPTGLPAEVEAERAAAFEADLAPFKPTVFTGNLAAGFSAVLATGLRAAVVLAAAAFGAALLAAGFAVDRVDAALTGTDLAAAPRPAG
jgi:hypothetical protein